LIIIHKKLIDVYRLHWQRMFKVIKSSLYKELYEYKLLRQIVKGNSPPGTLLKDTGKNY